MVQEPTEMTDAQHHEHIDCTFCRQQAESCEATIRDLRLDVEHKQMHIEALASDVTLLKEQVRRLEQELTGTRDAWELYGTEKRARVQAEQERDEADAGHADEYRIWVKMIDAETARRKQAEQRLS